MIRRALVANGDATDVATWSNIPHFFLQAGLRNGLLHGGVVLRPQQLRPKRSLWNALRPLVLDRPSGWQYSRQYANAVWAERKSVGDVGEYISHYQLLPPRDLVREPITYYIDATLRQWFDGYGYHVGRRVRFDALAREREAYLASRFVVCMSKWCADDVISSYGVPSSQVRSIAPGANLDEGSLPPQADWDGELTPLRLGFIGVDWERKGGPTILDAATKLARMGLSVEVVVIGPDAKRIPAHPAVSRLGFIHKGRELRRFVELVRTFHFGCLLSRVEAIGFSTLEYLRLGVPIIATGVGGIVDPKGAGLRVPADADGEQVADVLADVVRHPDRYSRMREAAARDAATYSWDRAAQEMLTLLEGSAPEAYLFTGHGRGRP